MRFLADQDVYQSTVDFLRALDHDVVCVREIGMARASDEEILDHAHKEQQILLTKDKDFGALVFLRLQEHSGVILLRIGPHDGRQCASGVSALAPDTRDGRPAQGFRHRGTGSASYTHQDIRAWVA